ncbi:hypothetical protein B0A55_09982 [Friedmanniomyces simplex]|uniref:Uncharacterized protein n=1 Tax=Friedmanniomyces simplex TaxID=329884 RepID=A0A4U0WWK8_9PEZI|nr:hypothetical protein B0A55_09982 [Friedmanniomyces simplex]
MLNPPIKYAAIDWPEEQQFPLAHRIILGRSRKALSAELQDNPGAVRVKDVMGRTALDWATAQAHLYYMKMLVDYGSPLNTIDTGGRSTILHAVDSHNVDAVRILLEAGADPNPTVPNRSSPLNAASFGGLVDMVELLIKFGADVDVCNPEGLTALQAIATVQNAASATQCANILLDHGGDLSHISNNGRSALATAIIHNSHDVLVLFIERYDTGSHLGSPQLLPFIAEFADVRTMSIIAISDLLRLSLSSVHSFAEEHEVLRSRADYYETLKEAFDDLCRPFEFNQAHDQGTTS